MEDGVGRVRPLHRNMLLPFSCLPREGKVEEYDTVEDVLVSTTDPAHLTALADKVSLVNSPLESERIEEPKAVPVYRNPQMRKPGESGV